MYTKEGDRQWIQTEKYGVPIPLIYKRNGNYFVFPVVRNTGYTEKMMLEILCLGILISAVTRILTAFKKSAIIYIP